MPQDRRGEILIEPLHPRGRLLGGASKSVGAPKSKLAALAAARKKKENQRAEDGHYATSSVALLDRLGGKPPGTQPNAASASPGQTPQSPVAGNAANVQTREYPARMLFNLAPAPARQSVVVPSPVSEPPPGSSVEKLPDIALAAAPSTFAQTMLGFSVNAKNPGSESSDHYLLRGCEPHTEFNFIGPSPDDIILKAQNSRVSSQKRVGQSPQPASDSNPLHDVANGVKNVTIEEPKIRGKHLDVLVEFDKSKPKDAVNFVVIGMFAPKQ